MSNAFARGTLKIPWTSPEVKNNATVGRCVVLIPVYKNVGRLSKFEKKSIERVISILGEKYELMLLCGKSFKTNEYNEHFGYDFSYYKCNDDFFKSQKSYSDLCEKYQFYETLSEYEYMLIYQPDAWIFEDRLEHFINLGHDYIGSVHTLRTNGTNGKVGNGGFSLRKISKFAEVCKKTDFEQFRYTTYEDCVFTMLLKQKFDIATLEEGFDFGWQENPQAAFSITKKLPMGCHNPMRNNWRFWSEHIKLADEPFSEEKMKVISGAENVTIRPVYNKPFIHKPKKLISRPI